jgi:hypothetical protein
MQATLAKGRILQKKLSNKACNAKSIIENKIQIAFFKKLFSALKRNLFEKPSLILSWDFYFRALGSLVVLSFPQLLSFSSVLSKHLAKTVTSAGTAGCPMVEHL